MSLTTRIVITAQDNASRQFGNISQNGLRATSSLLKVNKSLMQTNNNLKDLSSNRALVGGGIFAGLVSTLSSFTKSSLDVKIDFDRIRNTLLGVTGSARKAGEEMAFLASESNRLGVELRPLGNSYARLLASTSAMGISLNDSRLIFTSFSQAISGMGASREQAIRIFSALDQMASKGCHAKGSLISMYDGSLKAVEDIKVGDFLLGDKLDAKEVITLAHGKEEMYKVIPDIGKSFIVNLNHKLCLNIDGEQEVVILKDYLNTDYIGKKVYLEHIDKTKKIEFKIEYFGIDDFYGFFISGNHLYLDYQGFIHHNTVSMEELKQQLGEALPSVLQIAAKSMNMTTEEFTKLVAQGKVLSKDFLVPFAKEVNKAFGGIAVTGAKLLNAELNRFLNTMDQLKLAYIEGGKGGESLADSLAIIIKKANEIFSNKQTMEDFAQVGVVLGKALLGLTNIIIGLNEVLQPLFRFSNSIINFFSSGTIGTIAFTVALKGLISTAKIAGNILGNLQGKNSKSALGSIGGGAVAGGSSRFQELMQSEQYSRFSPRLKDSSNIYGNGIPSGSGYSNFRNSAMNSFVSGSYSPSQSMGAKFNESNMTTLKNSADKLNNSKFGLAVSGVATKLFSLVNPLTLVIGAVGAFATALSHFSESKSIQASADSQDELTKAKKDSLDAIKDDLQDYAKKIESGSKLQIDRAREKLSSNIELQKSLTRTVLLGGDNAEKLKASLDKILADQDAKRNGGDNPTKSGVDNTIDDIIANTPNIADAKKFAREMGITLDEFLKNFQERFSKINPQNLTQPDKEKLSNLGTKFRMDRDEDLKSGRIKNYKSELDKIASGGRFNEVLKATNNNEGVARIVHKYQEAVQDGTYTQIQANDLIKKEVEQAYKSYFLNEELNKAKEDRLKLEERLKTRPEYQDLNSISSTSSAFKSFRAKSMFDRKVDSQMVENKKKLEDLKNKEKAQVNEAMLKLPSLLDNLIEATKNIFSGATIA